MFKNPQGSLRGAAMVAVVMDISMGPFYVDGIDSGDHVHQR